MQLLKSWIEDETQVVLVAVDGALLNSCLPSAAVAS